MEKFHIAIDGPAGSGKTTVSRELAKRLNFEYLDTGAMYRAVALYLKRSGIDPEDSDEIDGVLRNLKMDFENGELFINGERVGNEIRSAEAGMLASVYARSRIVREHLTRFQREIADSKRIVVEGRDIGTVVLPDADLKIYLTASVEERARRRYEDLLKRGEKVDFNEILESIRRRDEQDSKRDLAPLKPAPDAIVIDTTDLGVEEVVNRILELVRERMGEG